MARVAKPAGSNKAVRKPGALIQLFGLVILPITLLLLLIAFGSVYVHQSAMRQLVGERDQRAAQTSASAISEDLNHQITIAMEVALSLEDGAEPASAIRAHELALTDFDARLAIFSLDGTLLASNASLPFWQQLAALQESLTSDVRPFAPLGLRLTDEGERFLLGSGHPAGGNLVVLGAFSIDQVLERQLANLLTLDGLSIYLLSADGEPLYATAPVPTEVEQHLAENPEAGSFGYDRDDQQFVAAYSQVAPFGWTLVIEEPWEAVLSPLLTYTDLGPLVLAPLVLLALGVAWFALRQLIAPLRSLEAHSAAMTRGDYAAIKEDVGGIAEISRLQQSLVYLAEKVDSAQQNLRSYVGAITKGQEEERLRLAHELHDDTIQSLIALNQRIQITQAEGADEHSLAELGRMAKQTIEDLRRLTGDLRPLYLEDLGLAATLEMLAQESAKASGLPVEFKQQGRQQRLDPDVELALYRITQEALNNSLQHAGASQVEVSLSFANHQVEIHVADDGQGFQMPESPAEFAPRGHFGLLGMHERADLIGARLTVESQPGQGTQVQLSISSPQKDSP